MNSNITVVCAADNNYAMPLAVTACSILKNLTADRKLNLYVLDGGIEPRNIDKLLQSLNSPRCNVKFADTKGLFREVPTYGHFSEAIFHRLLIPELMPKDLHKVIYLDCDLLVLTDIGELWNIEIGDRHLLAVRDFSMPTISKGVPNHQELGIPATSKYFNSGVLVFNLDKWREDNTSSKIIEYLTKPREHTLFGDQEALNAMLWDKWSELDPKWNYLFHESSKLERVFVDSLKEICGEFNCQDIINNPYIIHFADNRKPWLWRRHSRKQLFYKYLDLTAWSGWRRSLWRAGLYRLQGKRI